MAQRFFDWGVETMPDMVPGALDYAAAGFTYRVSGGSFFQVNRFLIDQLVDSALARTEGGAVLDLYAGVGLFSLPLARRFSKVTTVESAASAVRDLRFNAERAGVALEIHQMSADSFLASLETAPDCVLADPPRAGLGKTVVAQLARLMPPRITIVACDPATLARDLRYLCQTSAAYQLMEVQPLDMFPQTAHIECVAVVRLSESVDDA